MKITSIKQQVKNPDRYSVYIDEKYTFSLSAQALIDSKLTTGQELDFAELTRLKDKARFDKAYYGAVSLIARRIRSAWEISTYLRRKNYSTEIQDQVKQKLASIGLLDDKKFAMAWIENRKLLKPTSKRRLTQELRQKRVDDTIIKEVVETTAIDESKILKDVISSKRRQTRYQDDIKLIQYLMRQGFSYQDVKAALEEEAKQ